MLLVAIVLVLLVLNVHQAVSWPLVGRQTVYTGPMGKQAPRPLAGRESHPEANDGHIRDLGDSTGVRDTRFQTRHNVSPIWGAVRDMRFLT